MGKAQKFPAYAIAFLGLVAALAGASAQAPTWEDFTEAGHAAWQQGRYELAEEHYAAALRIAERFGPGDTRLAVSLNNLGNVHLANGNYTQAEPLYRRALAIQEESLGREHPDVAQTANNLGELYRLQGKPEQAETFFQRALAIGEQSLGPQHPSVAGGLNNLAALYHGQGRYAEAEAFYRRGLAIWIESYGWKHPSVAGVLHNLGALYSAQGRHAEAEPLYRWALVIWEKTLGTEHPAYLQAREHYEKTLVFSAAAAQGDSPLHRVEMGAGPGVSISQLAEKAFADEALQQFMLQYFLAGPRKRSVFADHLRTLEAEGLLDFLEATYPMCHGEAHELGQAIFADTQDIGLALRQCQTRCTTACMHGVFMEASAGKHTHSPEHTHETSLPLADVAEKMVGLCEMPEITRMHKPGNCAHAIGHAFMITADHDIEQSLEACSAFGSPALAYYCATGVFMEYVVTGRKEDPRFGSLHFPCDTYTQFPAACYRYRVPDMLRLLQGDGDRMVAECLALPGQRRLGCFHGWGAAQAQAVFQDPPLLKEFCGHGTLADQTVCIEGVIEKLADFNPQKAQAACAALEGQAATVCEAAAREKMYRLDKPSMRLYSAN